MRTWSLEAAEAIVDGIGPVLSGEGFRRNGGWYQRSRGQLTDSVWFEAIKYRPETEFASVDVRFGIHIGGVNKIEFGLSSWDPLGPPCHVSRQSEPVFWDRHVWWDPLNPSSTVIPTVGETVRTSALPFFDERFRSLDQILDYLERDYLEGRPSEMRLRCLTPRAKITAMRVCLSRGEWDRAEEAFRRLFIDREEARSLGLPERDPLIPSLLQSVAEDAHFPTPDWH